MSEGPRRTASLKVSQTDITAIRPYDAGADNVWFGLPLRAMAQIVFRPLCPKCGMSMIATWPLKNGRQTFECLRCGHKETRQVE